MKTTDAPPLYLRASVAPATANAEARTVELVFSTGAAVERFDYATGKRYLETLSLDPKAVRLDRLNAGAPLLDSHAAWSVADAIGAVVPGSAQIVKGEARASVRFSRRESVEPIWQDVRDGILSSVSVGYRVHKFEETAGNGNALPVRKAVDWEPYEVSLVPMPADAGARVREEQTPMQRQSPTMPDPATDAVELERQRCEEITRAVRVAHLEGGVAERLIAERASIEQARSAIFAEMARRDHSEAGPGRGPSGVDCTRDGGDDFQGAAADALLLRSGVRPARVHPGARDVEGSALAIARTCLGRLGRSVSGSPDLVLRNAMTTSDFPLILANGLNKAIRVGYESEPASHRAWVRVATVPDFKTNLRPILGSAPELLEVKEAGEYTHGAMNEDSASYVVAKFGRIVSLSWETLVNDDLSAFLRVQPALGQAARRKEADIVYVVFTANAGGGQTMQDTVALFHATHGNLTAAFAALDASALGAAREKLRMQQALGGGYMALVPRFLIVAPEHEQAAEVLLAASSRVRFGTTTEGTDAERPSWLSSLDLVVEPRLAGLDAAYLAAGNDQIDTVELGLLDENMGGPVIAQEQTFVQDVFRWKARHVAGARALDWRGLVKIDLSA